MTRGYRETRRREAIAASYDLEELARQHPRGCTCLSDGTCAQFVRTPQRPGPLRWLNEFAGDPEDAA